MDRLLAKLAHLPNDAAKSDAEAVFSLLTHCRDSSHWTARRLAGYDECVAPLLIPFLRPKLPRKRGGARLAIVDASDSDCDFASLPSK